MLVLVGGTHVGALACSSCLVRPSLSDGYTPQSPLGPFGGGSKRCLLTLSLSFVCSLTLVLAEESPLRLAARPLDLEEVATHGQAAVVRVFNADEVREVGGQGDGRGVAAAGEGPLVQDAGAGLLAVAGHAVVVQ